MRGVMCRAAALAGAVLVLLGPAVGVASAAGGAAASAPVSAISWSIQHVPEPPGAMNPGLGGVSCPSATACTSAGAYNPSAGGASTLAEHWNGKKWSVQTTPDLGVWDFFNAVSCASTTSCVAVGYHYPHGVGGLTLPLAEIWNGKKWTIESAPNPTGATGTQLTGVSCTSPAACTAVGYATGKVARVTLAERWNGTKWSIQTTPSPGKNSNFDGVSCASPTVCSAVGYSNGVLAEQWNGTKWSIQTTPTVQGASFSLLGSVSCTSGSACTAIGVYNNSAGSQTLAERWNGTRWSIQSTPKPAEAKNSGFGGVSCTSASACVIVGSYTNTAGIGLTLAERWNGTRWSIQSTPNPTGAKNSGLGGVSCASASACTAMGGSDVTPPFAERYGPS